MLSCSQGLLMPMFSFSQGLRMPMFSCSLIKNGYWKLKLEQEWRPHWKKKNYGLETWNAEGMKEDLRNNENCQQWRDIISATMQITGYLFLENEVLALPVFEHTESLERAHNVVCVDCRFLTQIYRVKMKRSINLKIIIIIIFYFENVAFFHAKLWSDICPRVDNQTSGNRLQDSTRPPVEKSQSASYPPMGIEASFWWRDALPHQPVRIREETLESGNLFNFRLRNIRWEKKRSQAISCWSPNMRPYLAGHPIWGHILLVTQYEAISCWSPNMRPYLAGHPIWGHILLVTQYEAISCRSPNMRPYLAGHPIWGHILLVTQYEAISCWSPNMRPYLAGHSVLDHIWYLTLVSGHPVLGNILLVTQY